MQQSGTASQHFSQQTCSSSEETMVETASMSSTTNATKLRMEVAAKITIVLAPNQQIVVVVSTLH